MKLPPFTYHRPTSTEHALELLAQEGSEAKLLGGGQSLLPLMALRMAAPTALIDVGSLDELRYVRWADGAMSVGGTTRHATLEDEFHGNCDDRLRGDGRGAFADALPLIGHLPIRTRGTIGGSLAHADATAELPLLARTFDAAIVARSREGERVLPAASFFEGMLTTALEPTEMVSEVRFPDPPAGSSSAFEEFSERAGDFALASACVAVMTDATGTCSWCRVGLGAVAATPVRSPSAEDALLGQPLSEETIRAASAVTLNDCEPRGGLHCSSEFRGELLVTVTERALRRAVKRSKEGGHAG